MSHKQSVHIIGGGLAGSEAAWQLVKANIPVVLHEMRPHKKTDAHHTEGLAELVCSNSFRSDDAEANAVGLIHQEMRKANSLIMEVADLHKVPAGSALAVDREQFSATVQEKLLNEPLFTLERREITDLEELDWPYILVATGPLTSDALSQSIQRLTGQDSLAFFDAIAPIIYKESIDFDKAWFQSRYDKGEGKDYINCPMTKEQYEDFIAALVAGDKTQFKEWEKNTPYFEGCLPIEVMAERGPETLRFGPMKPVGLTNPHPDTEKAHAVVQLRQDNALGTLYNIVGFQTKLTYGEQQRIFKSIPGLENAEFARLGGIHRNSFIKSPDLLDETLRLKNKPSIRFAGQITGVEGYVESAAMGLLVGRFIAQEYMGQSYKTPPETTAMGALLRHITCNAMSDTFQPMNVNFGLFPKLETTKRIKGKDRKIAYTNRAREDYDNWV
jgi:methylenetetrahydrofolate--tRNA-(uracil-5-)-methyltransferase